MVAVDLRATVRDPRSKIAGYQAYSASVSSTLCTCSKRATP